MGSLRGEGGRFLVVEDLWRHLLRSHKNRREKIGVRIMSFSIVG